MNFVLFLLSAFSLVLCLLKTVHYYETFMIFIQYEWHGATVNVETSKIFDMYLEKFNKTYNEDEYQTRLSYFKESMKEIHYYNSISGAKHGWTQFTDMSKGERSKRMLKRQSETRCYPSNVTCLPNLNETVIGKEIYDKVDWREKGAIGPVLNQLQCGCCWAVSIVGNIEAMAVKNKFPYQQLSVQELIDCSTYTKGCEGGSMHVLEFLCTKSFAVTTEEQYPLLLVDGTCVHTPGIRRIKEYRIQCDMNEDDILRVLSHYGPVVVVVNPGPLFSYNGGVIQRACARSHDGFAIDHMIQIVGYDLTGDVKYYIAKNSWGSVYGENGYVRLAVYQNMCGLAEEVAYFDIY